MRMILEEVWEMSARILKMFIFAVLDLPLLIVIEWFNPVAQRLDLSRQCHDGIEIDGVGLG